MELIVKGGIILPKSEVPTGLLEAIKRELTHQNPFDPEQYLYGFRENKDNLYIPKSFSSKLRKLLPKVTLKEVFTDSPAHFELTSSFSLRDYQQKAEKSIIELLQKNNSVLFTADTGGGKSYSITSVVQKLGQKTLILAHLSMLTHQLRVEMEKNSSANIVTLDSRTTEEDIKGADILIATFSLLHQNSDLVWYLSKHIGTLVVDETENILSKTRLDTIFRLNPKYSIFMSATPTRELLKQTPLLQYFISDNVVEMEVPEEYKVTPKIVMLDYTTLSWSSPANPNWYKVSLFAFLRSSGIITDLCDMVQYHYKNYGGCQWVVADLKKAQNLISITLRDLGIPKEQIAIIRGDTSKKERVRIVDGINSGDISVLIGSAPLSAGISLPNLTIAYRLLPHSSSDEVLTQQIGRLKRYTPIKETYQPIWFDFAIEGSLAYGGKKRFKLYKNMYDTTFITTGDYLKQ